MAGKPDGIGGPWKGSPGRAGETNFWESHGRVRGNLQMSPEGTIEREEGHGVKMWMHVKGIRIAD